MGLLILAVASYAQSAETTTPDAARKISLYPNPATEDYVYVNLDALPSAKVKLTLHNIIGNEIPAEVEIVSPSELRLRIKDLASGYYLVAIREEGSRFKGTYKFLKR